MRKGKSPVALSLLRNSKSAMIAAIEIHNKPILAYRYEVSTMLIINSWELLLKAYIYKFLKDIKLFEEDGKTKSFDKCIQYVFNSLGKNFQVIKESLDNLYKYRNKATHFYNENIDALLFSLIRANVGFYVEFINKHFAIDLSKETGLILLPIGFMKPFSPIDFLSNTSAISNSSKEVKDFIEGIIDSSKRLKLANIEESILVEYKMSLINEKNVNNADLVAAINNAQPQSTNFEVQKSTKAVRLTNDPNAEEVRVTEDSLFQTIFTQKYADVTNEARRLFDDFLQNQKFNNLMRTFRRDSSLHKPRYIDPNNPDSGKKDFYSKKIYDELAKHYKLKKDFS